jgi:release factor glutamine methyltransferase
LIPRPETELLVQQVIDHARAGGACGDGGFAFLDLGTGSGCIVTAILKYLTDAHAVATDISPEALAIAERNATRHGITERVRFIEADRLELPAGATPDGGFHAIVSNPPYIRTNEMATLAKNVRDYEPALALTDGGDGLSFFRTLAEGGPALLRMGGSVFVEVADGQSPVVREIFTSAGRFEHAGTQRDTTGPHDRAMHFRLVD